MGFTWDKNSDMGETHGDPHILSRNTRYPLAPQKTRNENRATAQVNTWNEEMYCGYYRLVSCASSEPDCSSILLRCGVTVQSDFSQKLHPTTPGVERFQANSFSLAKLDEGKWLAAQWRCCIIRPSEEATIVGSDSVSLGKYQLPAQEFRVYTEWLSTFLAASHDSDPVSLSFLPSCSLTPHLQYLVLLVYPDWTCQGEPTEFEQHTNAHGSKLSGTSLLKHKL